MGPGSPQHRPQMPRATAAQENQTHANAAQWSCGCIKLQDTSPTSTRLTFAHLGQSAASRRPRFKSNRGRADEDMPFRSAHNVHRMHRPTLNRSGQAKEAARGTPEVPKSWTLRYHNRSFSKTPSGDKNWASSVDRLARDREYPQTKPMFADVPCHIAYSATLSRGGKTGQVTPIRLRSQNSKPNCKLLSIAGPQARTRET